VTSLLAIGCSSKPNSQPSAGSSSGAATTSDASVVADAKKSGAVNEPIVLPKMSGKPPAKTSRPHTKAEKEALSKLEFKGFVLEVGQVEPGFAVRQQIPQRPKIQVQVNITACKPCRPMQLEKWSKTELKAQIPIPLRLQHDFEFDVGETDLGGAKLIYTYELGQYFGPDASGEQHGQYTDAYVLFFNDGINQIRVATKYDDDPVASKEKMAQVVPREDLEKIGKALLDSYVQAWGN
jgi:hypothetical protein